MQQETICARNTARTKYAECGALLTSMQPHLDGHKTAKEQIDNLALTLQGLISTEPESNQQTQKDSVPHFTQVKGAARREALDYVEGARAAVLEWADKVRAHAESFHSETEAAADLLAHALMSLGSSLLQERGNTNTIELETAAPRHLADIQGHLDSSTLNRSLSIPSMPLQSLPFGRIAVPLPSLTLAVATVEAATRRENEGVGAAIKEHPFPASTVMSAISTCHFAVIAMSQTLSTYLDSVAHHRASCETARAIASLTAPDTSCVASLVESVHNAQVL